MLILTRNANESIMIADDVVITVLGSKGGQVRIGIEAPADVSVHREEIYNRIKAGEPETAGQNSRIKDENKAWKLRRKGSK